MREQKQEEKPRTTEGATACRCHDGCSRHSLGEDKACQTKDAIAPSGTAGGLVIHEGALSRACASCSTLGVDSVDSTTDAATLAPAPAPTAVKEEADKRVAAAMASAALAQVGATAWASAFSAATQLFHAALVYLCDEATGGPGEGDGRPAFEVSPLTAMEVSASNKANSSAVVPWVPTEAKTDATTALQALRDSVQTAVEGVRQAVERTARKVAPPASKVTTTGSQTVPEPPAAVVPMVSKKATGSQTDEEPKSNVRGAWQQHVGVQAGGGGAPAWEGNIDWRCSHGQKVDCDEESRPTQADGRIEELERTAGALNQALQQAEDEKEDLEQMLTRRFEAEKVRALDVSS